MRCRSGVVITPPKSVMTPLYASDHYGFSAAKRLRSTSCLIFGGKSSCNLTHQCHLRVEDRKHTLVRNCYRVMIDTLRKGENLMKHVETEKNTFAKPVYR